MSDIKKGKCPNDALKLWRKNGGISGRKKDCIPWNKGLTLLQFQKENHYKWIEDRTQLKEKGERRSPKYKDWVKRVKDRDNWKCKINNCDCDGKVAAHHILGYTNHPKLRYEINNGITLCRTHHPRKRNEEKRLIPVLQELVGSKE